MEVPVEDDVGVCNCCLTEGSVRSMLEYTNSGDVCTQLFLLCFGLDVLATDIGDKKRVICPGCELRLRESLQFRRQVERALRVLEHEAKGTEDKPQTSYKFEDCNNIEDFDYDAFIDAGDFTDINVKNEDASLTDTEQEVLELTAPKTKSKLTSHKIKTLSTVKKKLKRTLVELPTVDEMKTFLDSGLFPFKGSTIGKYQCVMCVGKYNKLSDMKDHMSEHTNTFKMDAIKKMIRAPSTYQFEVRSSKLRCKLCSEIIENYSGLEEHVKCCSNFKNKRIVGMWREKLPFKLEKDQLDCPICKKRFLNYVSLNTHMNVHYPNFICENCGKAFASKPRLKGHMRIHEVGEFPCKFCEMVFDKVTKRENHVSKQHKAGVRYSCPRCGISLTSFYARQKHLAEAHNEELKRYKCSVCTQSYITPGHLSSHVRRDHLNERNHRCDKCDLAFYTRHSLTMHMIKHDGERIFSCQICTKSYQRAKTLKEHMRIHNNDKRFMCPACGRAFTQKCTLKSHLKVHERKTDVGIQDDSTDGVYGIQRHSV